QIQSALIRSREELLADKVKMESMVVSMVEGVIMLDEKGKIVLINPQARWMLGFGFNEEIDDRVLAEKFIAIKLDNAYKEHLATKNFVSKEVTNPQGHFLRCELNPVQNAALEVIGIVVILRDITKEKELDALKSEFVSTVSHELRTPLSITKEGVSLILDEIPGKINEKQRKILATSRDNMDRLARIINSLLDISKIESGKVELRRVPVDVKELINKVALEFEHRIKSKGLNLELDVADKSVMVYADPDKLIQVLTNLIGNAYKFTQKGKIAISCHEKGDKIECSVEDTGVGLSPDDLAHVFEKFKQFSRVAGAGEKGTGLGLSIAKALVEMHKGSIRAESTIGKGSKFSFSLPNYTSAELFKETVKQGVSEALKKNLDMSVVIVSLVDFDQLRKEIPVTEVRDLLKGLEEVLKSALRREGDMVIRDTGEIIVVLVDCSKEDVLRVEGRLEQAVGEYLAKKGLKDKIKLHLGSSSYPDDARNEDELIRKAKA
ncbi:MAG: ATP-binding protein, partial [Candidatus Omnitrophica bacterium]|nr:ATP-binding protein [Candidatus Omnitrophota bacterium]